MSNAIVLQTVYADQGNFTSTGGTFSGTITGVTAGSYIFVIGTCDSGNSIASCADNVNGAYSAVLDHELDTPNSAYVGSCYLAGSAAGTLNVTLTFSGTANARGIAIIEVANVNALDTHNGNYQATTLIPTVSMTNAHQPALIVGTTTNTTGDTSPIVGAGYTDNGAGWTFGGATPALIRVQSLRVTATGANAVNFVSGSNSSYITLGAIFDEGGGVAPATVQPPEDAWDYAFETGVDEWELTPDNFTGANGTATPVIQYRDEPAQQVFEEQATDIYIDHFSNTDRDQTFYDEQWDWFEAVDDEQFEFEDMRAVGANGVIVVSHTSFFAVLLEF